MCVKFPVPVKPFMEFHDAIEDKCRHDCLPECDFNNYHLFVEKSTSSSPKVRIVTQGHR